MQVASSDWRVSEGFQTVGPEDLEWWLEIADSLEWRWAKTYADSAPHWYLLRHETRLTKEEYDRAHRVILTFGVPEMFWGGTNMYLRDRRDEFKWWVMGPEAFNGQSLINRGPAGDVFGPQNAPSIRSKGFTEFDAIATDFDRVLRPRRDGTALWRIVNDLPLKGNRHPTFLDVGCGTGRAIDIRLPHGPEQYTGVDPSLAMLNQFLLRHWKYRDIHCERIGEFLEADNRLFDTVLILGQTWRYLSIDEIIGAAHVATRQVVIEIEKTPDGEVLAAELHQMWPNITVHPLSNSWVHRIEVA